MEESVDYVRFDSIRRGGGLQQECDEHDIEGEFAQVSDQINN
jgi:hypothetical protein